MTCAKELQGTVELGVLASSRERCRVQIDLDVGRDAFTLDDLLVECERCHRWQVDIDGCLTDTSFGAFTDMGTVLHVPDDDSGYLGHTQ